MCDSFPAISAEQLTKAVNLAAAGTLSALNGNGEDVFQNGSAKGKKSAFDNGAVKDVSVISRSSIQSVPGSPKMAKGGMEDVAPSTSFYGRARKISTKKKLTGESPTATSGKKYSSRKNYKLSPPLIPNGIKNIGAQVLLNSQVVKISHTASSNIPSSIQKTSRVASSSHTVRPITLIHSPQIPQSITKNGSESNSLLSSILQSPPREISQASPELFLQKLHTEDVSKKTMVVSPSTLQAKDKSKIAHPIPITKPDSVFRVPFPVSHAMSTPTTSFQIVRLPGVSLNSANNFSILNVGSPNCVSPIVSSNQVFSQMVLNKEKSKPAINTAFVSPSPIDNQAPLPSTFTSTSPSHVVTSCIATPKCFTVFHPTSTTATKQIITTSDQTATVGANTTSIVSVPHPVNLSSFTHQLISPVEKASTSIPHSAKSSSAALTQSTSRYVTIRPNLILPKDCKISTIMTPTTQVHHPLLIVSSPSNVSASTAKNLSSQSAISVSKCNSDVFILPPVIDSIPVIQSTTQSPSTAQKLQLQHDIKSPGTKIEIPGCNIASSVPEGNAVVASQAVQQTCPISPSGSIKQTSSSVVPSESQTPTTIHLSCHNPGVSSVAPNYLTVTKTPAVSSVNPVKSAMCCVPAPALSSTMPISSNVSSNGSATYCMPSLQPASSSNLISKGDKSFQNMLPPIPATPGTIVPRMPLTVVENPFSSRKSQNKVRLTVYPLPPGFQLASTSPTATSHSQAVTAPSFTSTTSKSEKDRDPLPSSSSQTLQISSGSTNLVTTSLSVPHISPFPSNAFGAISTNSTGIQNPIECLQPSDTKGRKLVISPAGINQLQALLRKMGTKEGYFIISTPRSVADGAQQKPSTSDLHGLTASPVVSVTATCPQLHSVLASTAPTSNIKNTETTAASSCATSFTSEPCVVNSLDTNSLTGRPSNSKHFMPTAAEIKGSDIGKLNSQQKALSNQTEAMSGIESEILDDEDSDDEDASSTSDSTCSSNALVIETNDNDHVVDSLNPSSPMKDLEDASKPIASPKGSLMSPSKLGSEPISSQNKFSSVDMSVSLDSNLTSPLSLNEVVRQHQARYGLEYQPLYSPPFATCKEVTLPTTVEIQEEKTGKQDNNALSNAEGSEIRFPIPESPLGISSLIRHHQQQQNNSHHHHHLTQHESQLDNQHIYEQSLNTPHALYLHHDQINDVHMHNSSDIEAAMNLQRLSECPGPPPPSTSSASVHNNSINVSSNSSSVTSPKSPLSINSSHPVEPHTPLHPPMTPNTMLINLLNRVPTPLLTNHQDLLSVPSSQENEIHFQGHNHQSLESTTPSTNKELLRGKSSSTLSLQESLANPTKGPSCGGLYEAASHSVLPDNNGSFGHTPPQNALDLIASNYLPSNRKEITNGLSDQIPAFSNSVASTQNFALFSTSWNQGNSSTMTFSTPEYNLGQFSVNVNTTLPDNNSCSLDKAECSSHCKTCCLPITITVNLDANNESVSNTGTTSTTENHPNITEPPPHGLDQDFHHQHHQLPQQQQQQQCVSFDNFATEVSPAQEKCRDAEIIRHLIMNTGTKTAPSFLTESQSMPPFELINQPLQNCHFEQRTQQTSFISSGESSNDLHCSVSSESNSQFDPASFHQRMPMPDNLSQENCHENFSNLSNSGSLIYDNAASYENVQMQVNDRIENCSFNVNSSASEATFGTSVSSAFDTAQNPVFISAQNATDSSYIMPSSLSDIHSSFNSEAASTKEQMSLHQSHIQSDGKHTQSSEFSSSIEQNELFFHQSSTAESHSNNLHLYDMNALHDSSHEMGYSLSGMENHENQLQSHQECLQQSTHCPDIQSGLITNQCNIQGSSSKQLQDHPFDFSMQQNHQFSRESVNQTGSDASAVTFSDHQSNLDGYMNETFSSHFYAPNSSGSNIPMFSQQCPVGSEAPLMDSNNLSLNCSQLPSYKNAAADIQMEFHYQPQDNNTTSVGEKQLVLPSASFSPPSVADPAVTPDPGAMEMYNGSFQNLSAYDSYLRGGQSESRAQLGELSPESGKFCVECNIMYKNQCKFHPCDCNDISDAPILSHARLTLPPCLKVAPSEVAGHTNKTGVFAKETIAVRTKFGPLVGSPVSCDQLGSTRSFSLWQTFVGSNVKVIDTSDENSSNWLMFVKPACISSEQNIVAFQHGNRVYFVTRSEVKEGEELRYWFSKDYARMLGISSKPKNAQHQLCPHCPVCKQVFADRKQVRSHIRIQHPKPQVNKCSHCSKRFSQVSHLNAHVLAVHLNVKKFVCHHCNKRFGDSSNLRKHVKSHSDERNFKCQICSKAFRQKAHLQVHMNSHMPVKHEQCRYCGSRFTRAFERKQHELQHTKQNRIECQHCGKVFYKQKIFKEHMKIHTNERNFPCSHCGKAFRNRFSLTRHGPTCKQRKRGLSLVPANTATNDILSRHLGASSSSQASPMSGSGSTTDFAKSATADEELSIVSSSTVSSSGLSNDV